MNQASNVNVAIYLIICFILLVNIVILTKPHVIMDEKKWLLINSSKTIFSFCLICSNNRKNFSVHKCVQQYIYNQLIFIL